MSKRSCHYGLPRDGHTLNPIQFLFVRELLAMAGIGKKFKFHGSFVNKAGAVAKERETPDSFVRERTVKGKTRYFVLTEKK